MLERFLTVAQDIFAHVTEVEHQLTVIPFGVGQRRIHQPKLDILDVRFLKVRVVQPPHDTAPALLGIGQLTVRAYLTRADVVLSALRGVIHQVQDSQLGIDVARLLTVRVDLLLINDTRTVVTQRRQVILDVHRRVRLRIPEDRIDSVPCQMRTVLVITGLVDVL